MSECEVRAVARWRGGVCSLLGGLICLVAGCPGYSVSDRFPCAVNGDCPSAQPRCCQTASAGLCGASCPIDQGTSGANSSSAGGSGTGGAGPSTGSSGSMAGGSGGSSGSGSTTNGTGTGTTAGTTAGTTTGARCAPVGASCQGGCCTDLCRAGRCQCGGLQIACYDASDCCGAAQNPLITCGSVDGAFCCAQSTGPCRHDADCCLGACNHDAGSCL